MNAPITFTWTDDGSMKPLASLAQRADKLFVIGERYRLEEVNERSAISHSHEFAWLAEAWKQLPEDLASLYPSPEHLRKRALIEAGYYNEQIIDVGTKAGAFRVAAYARSVDDFALVIVQGPLVIIRTAKSQARRAMNRKEFQASKTAIMEIVSVMIGVASETLVREAGRAA